MNNWGFRIDPKSIWTDLGFRKYRVLVLSAHKDLFLLFHNTLKCLVMRRLEPLNAFSEDVWGFKHLLTRHFGRPGLKGCWNPTETPPSRCFVGWFCTAALRCSFFFLYSLLAAHGIALMLGCVPWFFLAGKVASPNFRTRHAPKSLPPLLFWEVFGWIRENKCFFGILWDEWWMILTRSILPLIPFLSLDRLYDFQSFPASCFNGFGEFWSKPTQIIVARICIIFSRKYIEGLGFLQFFFARWSCDFSIFSHSCCLCLNADAGEYVMFQQ